MAPSPPDDEDDASERLGRLIGRSLAAIVAVGLLIWLAASYV